MADQRDTVQLVLEVLGQAGLDNLAKSVQNYKGLLEELHRQYARGDIDTEEWVRQSSKMQAALEKQKAILDKASGSTFKLGRETLEAGRALQDFAQGGIGGILNNIEGLATSLGGGPGLAGVMTAVGLAAFFAKPYIEKWAESFGPVKTKVPEAADAVGRLTEAIKADKDAIEELRKKRELDYFELQKYTELTHKLNKAEQELDTARKARAVGAGESRAQKERASAFRGAVAEFGGSEAVMAAMRNADRGMSQQEAEQKMADALEGARNPIEAIRRLANQGSNKAFVYQSPEQRERNRRASEATDARLKDNARKAKEREQERRDEIEDEANFEAERLEGGNREHKRAKDARDRERAKEIREGVELGRRVGKAARRPQREPIDAGGHLPLMPLNASPERQLEIMEKTQDQMLANEARAAEGIERANARLRMAQKIGSRLENSPMPTGMPR